MSVIKTDNAPKAIGPYSQAITLERENLVFTAGQLGINPATGQVVHGGIETETKQALQNLQAVLKEAGSDLSRVVKTTVFLKDMDDFATMNQVYALFFPGNPPARSAVQVARLPKDASVEIEAVARITE